MLVIFLLTAALASEPLLLDAGPDPALDGFAQLDLRGADDARVRWQQAPQAAMPGDFPDPLAGDALVGGTLRLDLEPGVWHIWVMLGAEHATFAQSSQPYGLRWGDTDLLRVTPPTDFAGWLADPERTSAWPPFLPGQTAWDRVLQPAHPWLEADVTVGGHGLSLTPFGRPLQALVLAPIAQTDPVRARLAAADDARRDWFYGHFYPKLRDEAPPFATGPARVVLADWEQAPDPAGPQATWSTRMARGDRQGTVAWLLPGDAPVAATVEGLDDLDVELFSVGWLDAAQHGTRATHIRPTVLAPGAGRPPQGLPVGTAITVGVPAGARAGRRKGALVLQSHGATFRVPIDLVVLDLDLPLAPVPSGFIMQLNVAATVLDGQGSDTVRRLVQEDFARMRALGCEAITLKGALIGSRFPEGDPGPSIQLTRDLIASWAAQGGRALQWADPKVTLHQAGFVHPERDALAGALGGPMKTLLSAVDGAPLPVVVGLWEEEGGWKNADALQLAQRIVPEIRALAPHVRLGASAGHPEDLAVAGLIDVVSIGNLPTLRRSAVEQVQALGGTPWAYNLAPGRTGPLAAWAAGVEAFVQWHWSPEIVDPFHDLHELPIWWYAAPGPDGHVWHTAQAERFAQGIADTRYLALLETRATSALNHRSPRVRAAAAQAIALVRDTRATLDGALASTAWDGEMLAPHNLDLLREAVVSALLALPP